MPASICSLKKHIIKKNHPTPSEELKGWQKRANHFMVGTVAYPSIRLCRFFQCLAVTRKQIPQHNKLVRPQCPRTTILGPLIIISEALCAVDKYKQARWQGGLFGGHKGVFPGYAPKTSERHSGSTSTRRPSGISVVIAAEPVEVFGRVVHVHDSQAFLRKVHAAATMISGLLMCISILFVAGLICKQTFRMQGGNVFVPVCSAFKAANSPFRVYSHPKQQG